MHFLGHRLYELQGKVNKPTLRKLEAYEAHTQEVYGLGVRDILFLLYYWEKPVVKLAKMLQVSSYFPCY
jgi:hypothetical protein